MLEWLKKEINPSDMPDEATNNQSGWGGTLATVFNKKVTLRINKVPVTIGTDPDSADLTFFHNSVDNVHCTIDCQNRQFTITDNGTREGTQVNGEKIEPGVPFCIDDGDNLVLGKVKLVISIDYAEVAKREREALQAEQARMPKEKTYTVTARPVTPLEYDESEVVMISCGLESDSKKDRYTQEFSIDQLRAAMKNAEKQKAAEKAAAVPPVAGKIYQPEVRMPEPAPAAKKPQKVLLMTCISGSGIGEEIQADHFPFRIGRSKVNDYVLKIDRISREHMCITEKDGFYFVTDTNSTNGVRVNGIKIDPDEEYRIAEGDTIKLSDNVYRIGFAG